MLEGLESFDSTVNAWFGAVKVAAQEAAVGLATVTLNRVLDESPQYTGDFVSGWEVSFNTSTNMWRPAKLINRAMIEAGIVDPYQKGDENAIGYALSKASARLLSAKSQPLGTSIYLSNSAKHDTSYAWDIELGQIDFRSVNPNADRVAARGVLFTRNRFKHIGKPELAVLRSIGV